MSQFVTSLWTSFTDISDQFETLEESLYCHCTNTTKLAPASIYLYHDIMCLSLQDVDKPCDTILQQVSIEEILEEQRLQQQAKQETEKVKMQVLKDRGLSIPKADNLDEY